MNFFQKILNDVKNRQNIDLYLTLLIAVVVSILGFLGTSSQQILFSAIVAVLALIAFNLLQNRRDYEEVTSLLEKLEINNNVSERFFHNNFNPSAFRESVMVAKEAFFWGVSLSVTVPALDYAIEQGIKQGLTARFLMIQPESTAVEMTAFRNWYRRDTQEVNSMAREVLSRLSKIEALSSSWPGSIEVRTVNYLPPYIVLATDPHLPSGSMSVYLTSFRTPNENRPGFSLSPRNDPQWFAFFKNQFEEVWQAAEYVDLRLYSNLHANEK